MEDYRERLKKVKSRLGMPRKGLSELAGLDVDTGTFQARCGRDPSDEEREFTGMRKKAGLPPRKGTGAEASEDE